MTNNETAQEIKTLELEAREVAAEDRLAFLPRHFRIEHMNTFEGAVYGLAGEVTNGAYQGGFWRFFEVYEGEQRTKAAFIAPDAGPDGAPDGKFAVEQYGNGYEGRMSPETLGLAVSLLALARMAETYGLDRYADAFHALRDYACGRDDADDVLGFID